MREKKNANSPLAKWLPGGAMSSSGVEKEKSAETVLENEMIEQLQLELEEARRTIRGHESKILQLQEGWTSFWSSYDSFVTHLLRSGRHDIFSISFTYSLLSFLVHSSASELIPSSNHCRFSATDK